MRQVDLDDNAVVRLREALADLDCGLEDDTLSVEERKEKKQRIKIAVVALLWEMAHVDGSLDPSEFVEIIDLVDDEFDLRNYQTAALMEIVDFLRRQNTELNVFFKEVNDNFSVLQKERLFDLVWKVAQADGRIDAHEKAFAELLKQKLGL